MKKFFIPIAFIAISVASCTDYVEEIEDAYDEYASNNSESKDDGANSDASLFFSGKKSNTSGETYLKKCSSDPTKQCAEFDIIVRDFQADHSDFENFTEEASVNLNASWIYHGYQDDPNWVAKRGNPLMGCANADPENGRDNSALGIFIGTDGYPIAMNPGIQSQLPDYLQTKLSTTSQKTMYGEFTCAGKNMRGYEHELTAQGCSKDWALPVLVTPGMAFKYLGFDANLGEDMMYEPTIYKARDACDNQFFEQWYADHDANTGALFQTAGVNARMNTVLQLPLVAGTKNTFEIDYNWNNGGYFPLDVVNANNNWTGSFSGGECPFGPVPATGTCQYGPQSLSIFCPPYNYKWASSQEDYLGQSTAALCQSWKDNGGPKTLGAAVAAVKANGAVGSRHLRNYSLTMMGYAKFKYNKGAGETFEFVGDDDMWIYVDGVLAVDLGGTHLPAPGKVEMDVLAQNAHGCHDGEPLAGYTGEKENCNLDGDGSWKNGSWHHLHFFYADRQTDGSDMKIRSTLSNIAKSRYGQPDVLDLVTKVGKDGKEMKGLFLNTALDNETETSMTSSGAPSILVIREVKDSKTGTYSSVVYGFYVTSITKETIKNPKGTAYFLEGVLRDLSGNVISGGLLSGDKIAFNVMYDDDLRDNGNDGSFTTAEWDQLISWTTKMPFQVKSTTGKAVDGFDPKESWIGI